MPRPRVFKSDSVRAKAVELFRKLAASREVLARSGHQSNTNTGGGYLVDAEVEAVITSIVEQHGVFPSYARNHGMKSDTLRINRRSTPASFHFSAQGETAAESELNYGQVNHTAKKCMGFIPVTNELLDDADNAADDIALAFGQGYAEFVDTIGFYGDGGEDDGGFTGLVTLLEDGAHAGGIEAAAGHNTLLEVDATDLANLVAALPTRAASNAAWYCSHFGAAKTFYRLAAGAGGIGTNARGESTFWGWPIRKSPTLPAVDTSLTGDAMLLFGDLYQSSSFALRRGLTIEASALGITWNYDITKFRAKGRFSILHTDIGDASTKGAMVALIGKA